MSVRRLCLAVLVSLAPSLTALADEAAAGASPDMSARIDTLLRESWQAAGIEPAVSASDAEFLRRAYLDLTGRLPEVSAVRSFLADPGSAKRRQLVDRLLTSPAHATHFASLWQAFLLPDQPANRFVNATPFRSWLRNNFADNEPYDAVVRELLLVTSGADQPGPASYFSSQQLKPETLAANTSRALLGVQIQCAQCHDHPFDDWTQEGFWGYAAFFAQLERPTNGNSIRRGYVRDTDKGEVTLPDTDQVVPPRFLDGRDSPDQPSVTRRQRLAAWLVADQNPYFAKATVNRVWAIMFGRGLVDPVDNLSEQNPASHPQLLDELSDYFVATKYDLRQLLRTVSNTQAYQLTSSTTGSAPTEPSLFARMAVKTLTAEQLYDCLAQATARKDTTGSNMSAGARFNQTRTTFVSQFRSSGEVTDYLRGIPQALTLMNGDLVENATDLERSDILVALQAPFFSDQMRIETLFLATLSRYPSAEESGQFVAHWTNKVSSGEKQRALSDILWAPLNSAEFTLNH